MIKHQQFNPSQIISWMQAPYGVVASMSKPLAELRVHHTVGNWAESMVSDATRCIVVGLFDDARQLLTKADEWLSMSIAENEVPQYNYGKYGTEASRFAALQLCRWLLNVRDDKDALVQAIRNWDLWLQKNGRDKENVPLLLPLYLEAEEYGAAIEHFDGARGLKLPRDAQKADRQAQVCYVLAKRRLGEAYQDVDERELMERFFKCRIEQMLCESQFTDVARWMKIAHWREGADPFATVLRCYDYLPHEPPAYP